MTRLALVTAIAAVLTGALAAQAPSFELSIASIMRGPERYGREPANVACSADGQWFYFQWVPAGAPYDALMRPYRVRPVAGATLESVSDAHMDSVAVSIADSGALDRMRAQRALAVRGDLDLITVRTDAVRRLTRSVVGESDPRFISDDEGLLFLRDGNAYARELPTGDLRQLTDVLDVPAPRDEMSRATGMRGAL